MVHEIPDDSTIEKELPVALERAGLDLRTRNPPLTEYVEPENLAGLKWDNPDLAVRTTAWGRPLEITADRITVGPPE